MSRCPQCNKKPYACHCGPDPKSGWWMDRDGKFYSTSTNWFTGFCHLEPGAVIPQTCKPSNHLLEVPPQWDPNHD